MNDRRCDVEHVDVDRVAMPPGFAESLIARLDNLGPCRMVLHERDGGRRFGRISQDAAVARDERDPRVEQRAEVVGFGIEFAMRASVSPAAEAGPAPRARRSAASFASATSVCSIRSSVRRAIVVAIKAPATASAVAAASVAAANSLVWNVTGAFSRKD